MVYIKLIDLRMVEIYTDRQIFSEIMNFTRVNTHEYRLLV